MAMVYIETSIVSLACARISPDPAIFALQEHARLWWSSQRLKYDLVTSQYVIDEISMGDPEAASRRLGMLASVPVMRLDVRVETVANELISRSLVPETARLDALHVACAAVAEVDFLLTQNCRHIANARVLPGVYHLLDQLGFSRMLICTPLEFLGDVANAEEPDS